MRSPRHALRRDAPLCAVPEPIAECVTHWSESANTLPFRRNWARIWAREPFLRTR